MKKTFLSVICLTAFLCGCQSQRSDYLPWHMETGGEQFKERVRAAVLLPLSGKSASVGEAFQNSAMMALQERPNSPLELIFLDTKGTSDGTVSAWADVRRQNPDVIIGPIFASELKALKNESPDVPILSFTTDNSLMEKGVYTLGVLIPNQMERLVQFMCESGQKKIAVIGPEDKTGELTMNTLSNLIQRCPDMKLQKVSLYEPGATDFTSAVLKIAPTPIDPKKKNLTPAEQELLETPIEERIDFDSLIVFDDGVRLQQVISLLAYYDVSPKVVPFYGLANWQSVKDSSLNGGYFAATPMDKAYIFNGRYKTTFGEEPPRIASLAYDAVSLVASLAERGSLNIGTLIQQNGFNGVNGRFKLNSDGTNERLLEVFQVRSKLGAKSVSAPPDDFLEPDTPFFEKISEETSDWNL